MHDLSAHLQGGIPKRDIDALQRYWQVFPSLRNTLFAEDRPGYCKALIPPALLIARYSQAEQSIIEQIQAEIERVTQQLANRVKELEERYAEPLPYIEASVEQLSQRVMGRLAAMGMDFNGEWRRE